MKPPLAPWCLLRKGTKLRRGRGATSPPPAAAAPSVRGQWLMQSTKQHTSAKADSGTPTGTLAPTHWFKNSKIEQKKTLKIHLFTFCLRFLLWKFSGVSSSSRKLGDSQPASFVPQSQEAQGVFFGELLFWLFPSRKNSTVPLLFLDRIVTPDTIIHTALLSSQSKHFCPVAPFFSFLPLRWWRRATTTTDDSF